MANDLRVEALGSGSARILHYPAATPLTSIRRQTLFEHLADAGVVLLRADGTDQSQFTRLVDECSSRMTFDPSREFVSKNSQLVNVGNQTIDLHCENANGPWRPDLAWFFCARAARDGGRTTICDGVRLWQELSPSTRALFQSTNIRYCRTYPPAKWKTFLPSLLPGNETATDMTVKKLRSVLDTMPDIEYRVLDDESVYAEYVCSAVCKTKFGGDDAFANSIRGPYGGQRVVMESREPIPDAVQRDVTDVSRRLTEEIPWQDGDVAVVDNTRFMHGRTAYSDPRRQIFAALSFHDQGQIAR